MSNGVSLHVLQHECKIIQICCTFTCDQSHKEKWIYFWKQFECVLCGQISVDTFTCGKKTDQA